MAAVAVATAAVVLLFATQTLVFPAALAAIGSLVALIVAALIVVVLFVVALTVVALIVVAAIETVVVPTAIWTVAFPSVLAAIGALVAPASLIAVFRDCFLLYDVDGIFYVLVS